MTLGMTHLAATHLIVNVRLVVMSLPWAGLAIGDGGDLVFM